MKIHLDKTRELYENHIDKINDSACYDNVWNLMPYIEADILFCFIEHPMLENVYIHHCVLIDSNNDVLDVTFFKWWTKEKKYGISDLGIVEIKRLNREAYLEILIEDSSKKGFSCTELHFSHEADIEKEMFSNGKYILKDY